jgi:hypothetical protein
MSKKMNITAKEESLVWNGQRTSYMQFVNPFKRVLVANGVMDLVTGAFDKPVFELGPRKNVTDFYWAGAADNAPTAEAAPDLYDAANPPVLRTTQLSGRNGLSEWLILSNYDERRRTFERTETEYKVLLGRFRLLVLQHLSKEAQELISAALEAGDPMDIWDQIQEKGKPTVALNLQDAIAKWNAFSWTSDIEHLTGV